MNTDEKDLFHQLLGEKPPTYNFTLSKDETLEHNRAIAVSLSTTLPQWINSILEKTKNES